MLGLTEPYWFWTFRYVDNRELAILAFTCDRRFTDIHATIRLIDLLEKQKHKVVDTSRRCFPTNITVAEWETWIAFELCPLIEIYADNEEIHADNENKPFMKWRRVKP